MAKPRVSKTDATGNIESANPAQTKPAKNVATIAKQAPRTYLNAQEYDHDLFKLTVAKMTKNVALPNTKPEFITLEHCHIFHTIDSAGKRQVVSTAVGGHVHEVKQVGEENGVPILEIGPAMKFVIKKKYGKMTKILARVLLEKEGGADGGDLVDDHTHDYIYMGSEKIKARVVNPEFAKFETELKMKREPVVDGVKVG